MRRGGHIQTLESHWACDKCFHRRRVPELPDLLFTVTARQCGSNSGVSQLADIHFCLSLTRSHDDELSALRFGMLSPVSHAILEQPTRLLAAQASLTLTVTHR